MIHRFVIQQVSKVIPMQPLILIALVPGFLAGVLASVVATGVGWALARYVFEFEWKVSLWVPLGGALVGALLALAAGWWGLREVLRRPVVQTLRQAAT